MPVTDAQTFMRIALCRAVTVADTSKICAARIDACQASVHISSNGLLLAVCEESRIRAWAMSDLLSGNQAKVLCEWRLDNGDLVKQAGYWRFVLQINHAVIALFLGTMSLRGYNTGSMRQTCACCVMSAVLVAASSSSRAASRGTGGDGHRAPPDC